MANICSIRIELMCENEDNLMHLADYLRREVNAEGDMLWLYHEHRPIFDIDMSIRKSTDDHHPIFDIDINVLKCNDDIRGNGQFINIDGWCKWGLERDEARDFLKYLKARYPDLKYAKIDYDECGSSLYGYYEYKDGELCDVFVDEDKVNEVIESSHDEDEWEYCCVLDEILKKTPTIVKMKRI